MAKNVWLAQHQHRERIDKMFDDLGYPEAFDKPMFSNVNHHAYCLLITKAIQSGFVTRKEARTMAKVFAIRENLKWIKTNAANRRV